MPPTPTFLHLALTQAQLALRLADPNPRVGCVITRADGHVLGQGHTQAVGGPHAEVMALRDAQAKGLDVRGGTAYVTLEPCAHHGRTPPCCDALIDARLARVVVALQDPNPLVAGQGMERMRAAGLEVTLLPSDDPLALEARELNIGFISRMRRQLPWVRMKIAASLDGQTALANGVSQWITSPDARGDGHAWRARASAVLTGVGTALLDKPRLDVRMVETPRQPAVVVVDSRLQMDPQAPLFQAKRPAFVYAAAPSAERQAALEAVGAQVVYLPDSNNKVDLAAMLHDMAQREINELHVEAGHKLNGSLLDAGLVDELLIYLAPTLMGQGFGMTDLGPYTELAQTPKLRFVSAQTVGPDLRILARIPGRDLF
jgi:diaminohydroxyphosphoribosylaminopyrimidine deaminase/5-amino-6-(5-phosphoribosylamino)uracil reductase